MKRIIALQGRSDSGKTTTICQLPDILLANGYRLVPGTFEQLARDFVGIYKKGNISVGVTSCGDTHDMVFKRLKRLVDAGCNICVCACRTADRRSQNGPKNGTIAAINCFSDFSRLFEPKDWADSSRGQIAANNRDAKKLAYLIEEARLYTKRFS